MEGMRVSCGRRTRPHRMPLRTKAVRTDQGKEGCLGRIKVVVLAPLKAPPPPGLRSPWGAPPTLKQVLQRAAEKAELDVIWVDAEGGNEQMMENELREAAVDAKLCMAVQVRDDKMGEAAVRSLDRLRMKTKPTEQVSMGDEGQSMKKETSVNFISLGGTAQLSNASTLLAYEVQGNFWTNFMRRFILERKSWAKGRELYSTMLDLYERHNADDLSYLMRLYASECVRWDKEAHLDAGGPAFDTLKCMLTNCRSEVLACMADENCRTAIMKLSDCGIRDQVKSYQIIASYESQLFADFSLCVLQKHNCMGNVASMPESPNVLPLQEYKGERMTHSIAEDILIGWLRKNKDYSWRVFAGQNAAYDRFPCQFQLFYFGKAKGSMWYDPVFRVETLDGKKVWRRRHYRVRRGELPGTFHFSVLDNGVVSKEFWKVVDCAEDMSWCILYYEGVASAAGTSYQGSILGTVDGLAPPPEARGRVERILEQCDIKPWELTTVDNACDLCSNAPLSIEEGGWF